MLKKIIPILIVAALLVSAGGSYLVWSEPAEGVSAADLEAAYMTPADRFVEIAGARVRVREEGPSSAPPLVLIHGFTFSLETWDAWADILKADYRVIRYDLLGHGLTGPDPLERYSPVERAEFLGDVLDALGLDSAAIAGSSLGGLAAWRFAASDPDRVDALILVSPGAYPQNGVTEEPADVPEAMKAYLLQAPEAGVAASARLIYGDVTKLTPERLTLLRAMIRREGNGAAMIKSIEEFTLPDPDPDLRKITAPTLILWGEKDALIPVTDGQRLQQAISDARLITYPGVGHTAQEEAPAGTAADALEFLKSVLADPSEAPS